MKRGRAPRGWREAIVGIAVLCSTRPSLAQETAPPPAPPPNEQVAAPPPPSEQGPVPPPPPPSEQIVDADKRPAPIVPANDTVAVPQSDQGAAPAESPHGQNPDNYALDTEQQTLGSLKLGKGFEVAKNRLGSMYINLYTVLRYINQLPENQSFVDHLGRTQEVNTRQDIQLHRVLLSFQGFFLDPKLGYTITVWGLNSTQQILVIGNLSYTLGRWMVLYGGIGSLPGTRTLTYNHPHWLANDRVMADEFFRPGFSSGIWAIGEPIPRLFYHAMIANNISTLGVTANEDIADMAYAANVYWMPTTGEFGEKNGFGDFEDHHTVATRFGGAYTHSRENRGAQVTQNSPEQTQIRISDSLFLFATGALADGVTVINSNFDLAAVDAGFKYRGFHLQTEYYFRWLSRFDADGPLPVDEIFDHGFYVQAAYMVVPKLLELYASTSHVFGQFNDAHEVIGGANLFPYERRNLRLNAQVIGVDRSPASSTFGYYVGGQKGTTIAASVALLF